MTHLLTPSPVVASVTLTSAAPAAPHTGEPAPGAVATDGANRIDRLAHLFRDSRAADEVHPLEHLLRRHLNGDRA